MRTTVTIDDELFKRAIELSEPGIEKSELIRKAMKTYVQLMAGRRLAALGGTMPDIKDTPRRKPED